MKWTGALHNAPMTGQACHEKKNARSTETDLSRETELSDAFMQLKI